MVMSLVYVGGPWIDARSYLTCLELVSAAK